MKPLIHYVFRHSMSTISVDNKFNIKVIEKEFINDNPILARKEAFKHYENYVHGYQLGLEMQKRHQLENEFLEGITFMKEGEEVDREDQSSKSTDIGAEGSKFGDALLQKLDEIVDSLDTDLLIWNQNNPELSERVTSPAVILIKDESLLEKEDDSKEIIIQDFLIDIDPVDPYRICELMMHLDEEANLYSKYEYDTGEELISIRFWDAEIYYEGAVGEMLFEVHEILKTDFDWSRYSLANWWNDPDFDDYIEEIIFANLVPNSHDEEIQSLIQPKDIHSLIPKVVKKKKTDHERILLGEGRKTEFKPDLFGYDYTNKRSFKYEAAKTICAFLNQKGGYLYIGVKDDGTVQGINMRGLSEDEFTRKFESEVRNYYIEPGIADDKIDGEFVEIDNKTIFRVKVKGSFKPVFLINKDYTPLRQEFYVRASASSRELYNPRHLLQYVESHWWAPNYRNHEKV